MKSLNHLAEAIATIIGAIAACFYIGSLAIMIILLGFGSFISGCVDDFCKVAFERLARHYCDILERVRSK